MSKRVQIKLPDGSKIEVTDDGSANLSEAEEAHWQQVAEEALEAAGRPLPEHLKVNRSA